MEPSIDRAHAPTRREFFAHWFRPGRPVLLNGMMDAWPAMGKWHPDYFRRIGQGRKVRIEWGNVLQEKPRFEEKDLAWYLDHIRSKEPGQPGGQKGPAPYLAYFDIFKCFPELRRDVNFGFWRGRYRVPIGWIGPAGTYTGLHWDVAPNLFAQFHGSKEFILYPPDQGRYLYPGRKYDIGSILSEVDARNPDRERHPEFAKARGIRVVVRPGEMLFTPRGWWHQVAGLETSISVSCFGFGVKEFLRDGLPGALKHGLHLAGLYRRGNCACHMDKKSGQQTGQQDRVLEKLRQET